MGSFWATFRGFGISSQKLRASSGMEQHGTYVVSLNTDVQKHEHLASRH